MRKVMVMEWKFGDGIKPFLADKGEAVFHEFGCDFMEMNDGNVNYSTAIVEWPDGTVENVPARNIRFLDVVAA